jgi:hydrogenase maturation protease
MAQLEATLVSETPTPPARACVSYPVLVLGVGNLIMGDEGVGIHTLRTLESDPVPEGVRLLDGGTAGINLLEDIQNARVVVMIDATRDGRPAGSIALHRPETVGALPHGLSAHDLGIKDLFAAAALLGHMPDIYLFTISVEEIIPMSLDLSPPVAAAVPEVVEAVNALVAGLIR